MPNGKHAEGVSDYMKIYGVGLGGHGQEAAPNKYSQNKLKVKLEPIRGPNMGGNLPKLGGGIRS